jgi:hypothetical protein
VGANRRSSDVDVTSRDAFRNSGSVRLQPDPKEISAASADAAAHQAAAMIAIARDPAKPNISDGPHMAASAGIAAKVSQLIMRE